jgi:protease-4
MKFLRNFAASLLAISVFFGIGFILFIIFISALSSSEKFVVLDNSVMRIDLTKPLAERDFVDEFEEFNFGGAAMSRIGTIELRKALLGAAEDDKIRGVVLYAPGLNGGFALGQEARQAITEFKESGKFVYAYSELLTEGGLYMSSVADEVYITPEGAVEWNGLASEVTFFKNAFDKLDIEPQIFRVGEYKGAVEPFMLDKLSDENREQITSMINSVYKNMIADMAPDLGLEEDVLQRLSNEMTVRTPQDAIDQGLITGVLYEDEFEQKVSEEIGESKGSDINWVSYRQYNIANSSYGKSKNRIAVVIADGDILMAKPQRGLITPTEFVHELRKARENDNVKAVVFRINSPGGDALASDLIWREVKLTAEVKPIIASMSNYAASGGYYIAMAADSIIAQPTTLTGSIGIFGIVFNIGDFMANKLGITSDVVTTGEYSDYITVSRALSSSEKAIIQNSVNQGYETFTSKAAEGRGMTVDQLKAVASGRVWTGEQAVDNGLIDGLGGLTDAIEMAAVKAGIEDDYRLRYYPVQKTSLEEFMDILAGSSQARAMKLQLGELYPYVDMINKVKEMDGIQARMPFELEW